MHGEQYGRLVDFDVNATHGWQQAGFPRAVITLLAQRMIAQMLRQVVDLLVADAESTGNTMWTAMVSKSLRSVHQDALWSSYYHQDLRPPVKFDVDVILERNRNHLNVLGHVIELMQTVPDYMRQCVAEVKAQIFIRFDDDRKPGQEGNKAGQIISVGSTISLISLPAILAEAKNLRTKLAESQSSTMPGAGLIKNADAAMRCFGQVVSSVLKFIVCNEAVSSLRSIKMMHEFCAQGIGMEKKSHPFRQRLSTQTLIPVKSASTSSTMLTK